MESANLASHAAAAAGESVYARSRLILLGLSLAAALLGIVIAWRLGTSVARPVAAMCRAAEAVARGEYETPLQPESLFHGELAGLRASLGKMLAAILAALEQSREISRKAEAEAQRALEAQHEARPRRPRHRSRPGPSPRP